MKIIEWSWQNYKSYGSVLQTIRLNQKVGELILLIGKNGNGKSAAISALELAIYGQEQNKRGTKLAKVNFPNRINGNMKLNVKFETDQLLDITRKMDNVNAALKTKLYVDGIPYDKANKIDSKIVEKIGFDYNTYKSFISMNVNNFKNFISLSPEEKRMLLDKLFNLEQINELNKILKQLQKNNDLSFSTISNEIKIYTENIEELEETIKSILEKKKINSEEKLLELKEILDSKKEIFIDLETQKNEIDSNIKLFNDGLNKLRLKLRDISRDISDTKEKIDLYKGGKCPTCHTELTGELNLLPDYEEKLDKLCLIYDKTQKKIDKATIELSSYRQEFNLISSKLQTITNDVTSLKIEIKSLKTDENDNLKDFDVNIEKSKKKIEDKQEEYLEVQKLKQVYNILLPIWGEHGIKRDIIESIITPLNEFIKEDLLHLKTRFKVELDNNFDAHIYEFNNEIDAESLSSGEAKKINLIIMLAYIKMLRLKREINILFLDEVFATIDITGVDDILILFKKFANERNVNVFLVHHSELKEHFFDKIINVHKTTFSYLETKQY